MKPVYDNLPVSKGPLKPRICSILMAPKEWLVTDLVIDFNTGTVLSDLTLQAGTGWLLLELTPESYDFEETEKSNRSGDYYTILITGTSNTITPQMQQVLNTLRYNQMICQVKDKWGRIKIVGDKNKAAIFQFSHVNKDVETVNISLTLDSEYPAPFFGGANGAMEGDPNEWLVDGDEQPLFDYDAIVLANS